MENTWFSDVTSKANSSAYKVCTAKYETFIKLVPTRSLIISWNQNFWNEHLTKKSSM